MTAKTEDLLCTIICVQHGRFLPRSTDHPRDVYPINYLARCYLSLISGVNLPFSLNGWATDKLPLVGASIQSPDEPMSPLSMRRIYLFILSAKEWVKVMERMRWGLPLSFWMNEWIGEKMSDVMRWENVQVLRNYSIYWSRWGETSRPFGMHLHDFVCWYVSLLTRSKMWLRQVKSVLDPSFRIH